MKFLIQVTQNSTQTTGGTLTIDLQDSSTTTNLTFSLYVPAANEFLMHPWSSEWIDLGNGVLSASANNVLNINLSSALTSGTVRIVAGGTEE